MNLQKSLQELLHIGNAGYGSEGHGVKHLDIGRRLLMHFESLVAVGNHSLLLLNGHHILFAVNGIALLTVDLDAACTKVASKTLCRHVFLLTFF